MSKNKLALIRLDPAIKKRLESADSRNPFFAGMSLAQRANAAISVSTFDSVSLKLEDLDLESAKAELANRVYAAALFLERLERVGRVSGNGHHMAQQIAAAAETLLVARWNPEKKG